MVNREVITHELKTPEEWEAELGPPYIMDPDGWRDPNGRPWDDPITRSEFVERLSWCTVTSRKPQRLDSRVSDE